MKVTPAGYAHMTNALSILSGGKLCILLEVLNALINSKQWKNLTSYIIKGGYNIKSAAEGVSLTVRALLGLPCPRIDDMQKPDKL